MSSNFLPLDQIPYEKARGAISDGDLITFFRDERSSLWHKLTTSVLKSPAFHCGIAIWLASTDGTKRLFICEAGVKRRLMLLSNYADYSMDAIACFGDFKLMEEFLLERVGVAKYGYADYAGVGLRSMFGLPFKDASGEICSELCAKAYKKMGVKLPDIVLAPGELHDELVMLGAKVKFKFGG
jgi:hypothetical protein